MTIELSQFKLSSYERVRIELPKTPIVTEEDIDAELFAYVAAAPKDSGIHVISDLSDVWVRANFDGISSLEQLRDIISAELGRAHRFAAEDLKYSRCVDALIERLEGEIPQTVLEEGINALRMRNDEIIKLSGLSKARYLEDEGLTESEYESKLISEAQREIALNIVLDKMIETNAVLVSNSEITDYIACEDPETFVNELVEQGTVEQARNAAARVKVMRRVMESAEILDADE